MAIGFKVCRYDCGKLFSPGAPGFGRTEYLSFGVTYPNPNCGPLTVYKDYRHIPSSWRKGIFGSLHVFRCSYEDSQEQALWASGGRYLTAPVYFKPGRELKSHTTLAKWVRLLEEIEPSPSVPANMGFWIDGEEFVIPKPRA